MTFPNVSFSVVFADHCPLYRKGDVFYLSDIAFSAPIGKDTCVVLVLDLTAAFFDAGRKSDPASDLIADPVQGSENSHPLAHLKCSGCKGTIRIVRINEFHDASPGRLVGGKQKAGKSGTAATNVKAVAALLSQFSFFKDLRGNEIHHIIPLLKAGKFRTGDTVVKKGTPGKNLYIMLSGRVEVIGDNSVHIAYLEKGEVFGEMSLISGDPVGATVRVMEPATIFYLNGQNFKKVIDRFPSLQMYFARLLARRLSNTNVGMVRELGSGMTGSLSEMPPSEVLQTLNQNQKTGLLSLQFKNSSATVFFKEGGIIRVVYGKLKDKEAFFHILTQRKGRFKFVQGLPKQIRAKDAEEIGDFMWLLMEGMNRIDESDESGFEL